MNTRGLFSGLAGGGARYARPDLAIGFVVWLVELAAVAFFFRMKMADSPPGASRMTSGG